MPELSSEQWQLAFELFDRASGYDPELCAEFLDEACGEDQSLRQAVEKLLAADRRAGQFIESPALDIAAGLVARNQLEFPNDEVKSRRIGAYQIIREIGRGGMGVVYLAMRADDTYRKQVAIKLVKRGMDTDFILRRFYHERQILATLDHPNIARLLDGGSTEDGRPYFVMEYIEGKPVDEYCNMKRLPPEARVKLFCNICSAVQYAHHNRIIHRDLKPGNILVTEDGAPKLLDFGVAKLLQPDVSQTHPTVAGLRPMTFAYASPEQARGDDVTAAGDVYSLGVVLYELLTGARPYQIDNCSPEEAARVINRQEPISPSLNIGRSSIVGYGLSSELDDIVLMALRKEPERRYGSARELSEDLERYLTGAPVKARKSTIKYRAAKFLQRHRRVLVASGITLFLTLLTGLGIWIVLQRFGVWQPVNNAPNDAKKVAVLPFQIAGAASGKEYLSVGLADALITRLNQTRKVIVRPTSSVLKYTDPQEDRLAVGRSLQVDWIIDGRLQWVAERVRVTAQMINARDGTTLWSEQFDQHAADLLAVEDNIAARIADSLTLKLTSIERQRLNQHEPMDRDVYELYLKGRYLWSKRTAETVQKAIEFFEQALARAPNNALIQAGLADCYVIQQNGLPRVESLQKSKALAYQALKLDPELAEAHATLGFALWRLGFDWAGAEQEFKRSLALNPSYVTGRHWYGLLLGMEGRFAEGEAQLQYAQRLDPLSLNIGWDLVIFYRYKRDFIRAVESARLLIDLEPAKDSPYKRVFAQQLAWAGRYDEALAVAEKLKQYSEPLSIHATLGFIHLLSGRHEEAEKIYAELEAHNKTQPIQASRSGFYAMNNRRDQAFACLELAYQEHSAHVFAIKVDPFYDNLRADPRFNDLLRRVGLER